MLKFSDLSLIFTMQRERERERERESLELGGSTTLTFAMLTTYSSAQKGKREDDSDKMQQKP
jgi:hypothetical protein